jgi:hypothetical protein
LASNTTQAGAIRSALRPLMGSVPATIHSDSRRASSAIASWMGPAPGLSATARRSASFAPMMAKFSGSTASTAPPAAASASSVPATPMLWVTSGPEFICMVATFK